MLDTHGQQMMACVVAPRLIYTKRLYAGNPALLVSEVKTIRIGSHDYTLYGDYDRGYYHLLDL